jgi:hypothetical protein
MVPTIKPIFFSPDAEDACDQLTGWNGGPLGGGNTFGNGSRTPTITTNYNGPNSVVVLGSDTTGACNTTYEDGFIQFLNLNNDEWVQLSNATANTPNTLCSSTVQADKSGGYYTLMGGNVYQFTFNLSTGASASISSEVVSGLNPIAIRFASAGDNSGYALTTEEASSSAKTNLIVGNYSKDNATYLEFNSFGCTSSTTGDTFVDNITFDQAFSHNIYFTCTSPSGGPEELYVVTPAQVCVATGGSGRPCSCSGVPGCIAL